MFPNLADVFFILFFTILKHKWFLAVKRCLCKNRLKAGWRQKNLNKNNLYYWKCFRAYTHWEYRSTTYCSSSLTYHHGEKIENIQYINFWHSYEEHTQQSTFLKSNKFTYTIVVVTGMWDLYMRLIHRRTLEIKLQRHLFSAYH